MSIKVCHLIDSNKATSFFKSIARLHDRDRFPVMIGSIAPEGDLQRAMSERSVPTFSLNATARWQHPLAVLGLASIIRRFDVEMVHAHCFDPTLVGLAAARIARVRFVFTRHHSDHHIRANKSWHTKVDGFCARRADKVIAVSEATRHIMRDVEHVSGSKITVVYNGMEPLDAPERESVQRIKKELALDGRHVCLMLARLHPEKGHMVLLEALPEIISRVGDVIVLLAGEGEYRREIEAEVAARGLGRLVSFLGQRTDVSELISVASLVVMPSLAESFGYAALEAMSLGKPVVATTTGGLPEVVADGETGLLVPPGDAKALAHAVSLVLASNELTASLGVAGQRRAKSFTFERMMRGYESVYQSLVDWDARSEENPDILPEPIPSELPPEQPTLLM